MRLDPLLLVALAACATPSTAAPAAPTATLEAMARRGPPLCHWTDVSWLQSVDLGLPYSGAAFGRAVGARAPRFTGVIRADGPARAVLEGHLHGDGIHLAFEVDASATPVLRVDHHVELAGAGLIVDGGDVGIRGGGAGPLVRIQPPGWALEELEPGSRPLTADVPCSELNLFPPQPGEASEDPDRDMLVRAGLPASAQDLELPPNIPAPLHESPGGPVALTVKGGPYGTSFYKLGDAPGGWARLAWVHWTGTVVWGWAAPELASKLVVPDSNGGLGLGSIGQGLKKAPSLQACGAALNLYASAGDAPIAVGIVDAGRTFEVMRPPRDGRVEVRFPGSWLTASEKGRLYLPDGAASCPAVAPEPPAR